MSYTIGSSMSGVTWNMRTVSGHIVAIHPGVGFTVVKDLYDYLIIDDFSTEVKPFNNHIETYPPEFMNIVLSRATVMFWMSILPRVKSTLCGKELRKKKLIDPMSHEGLIMEVKLAPLIKSIPQFGFPNSEDDTAQIQKYEMDQWHLARATLQKNAIQGKYTYQFLDCGKLLVELDGQISLIEFDSSRYNFKHNVKNLTYSAILQGIEEAHWEQRRIRPQSTEWANDPSYKKSMSWLETAWDEIQDRREEES
jgi:hypothetical protein